MNTACICLHDYDGMAASIAQKLGATLSFADVVHFADGEMKVSLENPELFTRKTVIIIQSTCRPVTENLVNIAFLAHELKNADAQKVILIAPYLGYTRQDTSDIGGKPGGTQVVANLLVGAGIDMVMTFELHEPHVISYFSVPFFDVTSSRLVAAHIKKHFLTLEDVCLIAPDAGAKEMVDEVATMLGIGTLVFEKERYDVNKTRITGKAGDCVGKTAILIDDIIDTGGTAIGVAQELVKAGFEMIYGYFAHPVLSGDAVAKIDESPFDKIIVSNSIPVTDKATEGIFTVYDLSDTLVEKVQEVL